MNTLDQDTSIASEICESEVDRIGRRLGMRGVTISGVVVTIVVGDVLTPGAGKVAMASLYSGAASEEHVMVNAIDVMKLRLRELAG